MPVPIVNLKLSDIRTELGGSALTITKISDLFEYSGVIEEGLDPVYCSGGLNSLRTKPYNIGKWRNYTTPTNSGGAYGYLYNWYAATSVNNIAPTGWHVPSWAEWNTLATYVGGLAEIGKLKSLRTSPESHPRWNSPNTGAQNLHNFNALAGAGRSHPNGSNENAPEYFYNVGEYAYYWTSELSERVFELAHNSSEGRSYPTFRSHGYAIRCVKDDSTEVTTVTDIDGNTYPTAKIGTQVWMLQDLKTTKFNNGVGINWRQPGSLWDDSYTTPAYCENVI